MKKVFCVFAVFFGVLFGVSAQWTTRPIDGGLVIISYTDNDTVIIIPAMINGVAVVAIGDSAFQGAPLTSVTIPNGVTSIGDSAFRGTQLTRITLPNSVISIGNWAFLGAPLTSVTLPNSVTSIGNYAFYGTQLTSITLPDSVISIGNSAFRDAPLTSVTMGNRVTSIGDSAFRDTQLTNITIPNSVTSIGEGAFLGTRLTSVTLPKSASIGEETFPAQTRLTRVTSPNSGNSPVAETPLPSVTNAAEDESGFTESGMVMEFLNGTRVTSPDSGNSAVAVSAQWKTAQGDGGLVITGYTGNDTVVDIPDRINGAAVVAIGNLAFYGTPLTSVTLPASVTSIGEAAFPAETKVTRLTVPASVSATVNPAGAEAPSTRVTNPSVTITIWLNNDAWADAIIVAFNRKYPDVKVAYQNEGSVDSRGKVSLDGPAGIGPDVFIMAHDYMRNAMIDGIQEQAPFADPMPIIPEVNQMWDAQKALFTFTWDDQLTVAEAQKKAMETYDIAFSAAGKSR
jgi:hypothetical protein